MKVTYLKELPAEFLELDPRDFHQIFSGPTIIELAGKNSKPIFVSTLLHGNEHSGVYALQSFLKPYFVSNQTLPRSMSLFIGNVDAAKENKRCLEHQKDLNRIWAGGSSPYQKMANEIKQYVHAKDFFAAVDIHNNTGWNPFYACVNTLENEFLNLAKLFSRRIVYFIKPKEVLSLNLKDMTTSITLECGQSGDMTGIQRCVDFLEALSHLEDISKEKVTNDEVTVYHSIARIKVPSTSSIGFSTNSNTDFRFAPHFERLNFMELQENALLGWRASNQHALEVFDEEGNDVACEFISYQGNEIRTKRPVIPSMFNEQEDIIRQDCLGYFMQRYQL